MPKNTLSLSLRHCVLSVLSVISAGFITSPTSALANNLRESDLLKCKEISDNTTRLACYDQVAGQDLLENDAAQDTTSEQKNYSISDLDSDISKKDNLFKHDAIYQNKEDSLSLLESRWELTPESKQGVFNMRAYKPLYLLPGFWSSSPNKLPATPNPNNVVTTPIPLDTTEVKYQLSFKTKAFENVFGDNGDIWMGYTQVSHWQFFNADNSRPFRETNYEPEVMMLFRNKVPLWGGWTARMSGISLNHQSNGREDPLSRSWNRAIGLVGLDHDNMALTLRAWYRIPEKKIDDDNPDISNYLGRGDALFVYRWRGNEFSALGRHSLRTGKESRGAMQLEWAFPIHESLRGRVQVFHGYGESMIDYNHKATYVGVGISLLEWF